MNELERAESALLRLDAGCDRATWVRVGMAVKAAGLPFEVFHDWSASGSNYAGETDCRNVWKSFDDVGGVSAATLFYMALEHDWKDSAKGQQASNEVRAAHPVTAPRKAQVSPIKQAGGANPLVVWELCGTATAEHPYIARKDGIPDGLRVYPTGAPLLTIQGQNMAGCLVIPCVNTDGKLQTLQFVPGDGPKLNLPGASFNGGFFTVGTIAAAERVYVVEGIGQAWACHAATGAAAVTCFGAGRMGNVAGLLRAKYPTIRIVVVPDRGKESEAEAIAAAVNGKWCELPQDKSDNYDANDYALQHGVDSLADLLERAKSPPMRFQLLSDADLLHQPPLHWMIRGVLPSNGLAALFGPSGSAKSFITLDICATVAGGQKTWFGRRVTQYPATYCVLEGQAGMKKRMDAWTKHHNRPAPEGLRFVLQPFDLLKLGDVSELAKAIQIRGGAGGLVVLDTLNRAAPGTDENSSVDMGNIIAASKRLQDLVGGLILLVHHTGKDATKGLRGHSSLFAALDGAIEVTKTDTRREWRIAKSKDDETGSAHAFKLEVVTVGFDDDGEEITSCVAVAVDAVNTVKRVALPTGDNQKIALEVIGEALRKSPEFDKDGAPPGCPCIRFDEAVVLVAERLPVEAKRRTERAQQAISAMAKKEIFGVKGCWLWKN